MSRPLLLDLYCGAGGAAMGYYWAGFDVVGVDIVHQPNYPFEFYRSDARRFLRNPPSWMSSVRVIHASPPCQRYSTMSQCRPGLSRGSPDLLAATRKAVEATGLPYVIENVPGSGARLRNRITLCGTMFGYDLYRHRLFGSNVDLVQPKHPRHEKPTSPAGHWVPGTVMSISGNVSPIALARELMEIDWTTREELAEAIPPYYTQYVGEQLL